MSTIDHPTVGEEQRQRLLDDAQQRYEHHSAAATEAMSDFMAILNGKPRPSDAHKQLFASDVQAGDHIQWEDAWWYVADATWCTLVDGPIGSGVLLSVARVGFEQRELRLGRDTALTVVRAAS